MLLKTNQTSMHGQKVSMPIVGEVEISEDGQIEVEQELAELLLQGDNWEEVQEDIEEDLDQDNTDATDDADEDDIEEEDEDEVEVDEENEEDEDEVEVDEELQALLDSVDKMTLEEMKKLAKDSKLKGYNLFASDVDKMRVFLKKKLQENSTNK